ncbi:hypothetical protein ACEPAF_1393 [Sanghuangporus sanghuang]
MSVPELIHTDSSTALGGDEMKNDGLPSGHGGADLEATTQTGVVDFVDSEIGALSRPGLVSMTQALVQLPREPYSDGSSPAAGSDIPKLGAIRADIDGALLAGEDGCDFTPRGSFNPPTTVVKKDSKKDSKKDIKNNMKKDTKKDTEDTKCNKTVTTKGLCTITVEADKGVEIEPHIVENVVSDYVPGIHSTSNEFKDETPSPEASAQNSPVVKSDIIEEEEKPPIRDHDSSGIHIIPRGSLNKPTITKPKPKPKPTKN